MVQVMLFAKYPTWTIYFKHTHTLHTYIFHKYPTYFYTKFTCLFLLIFYIMYLYNFTFNQVSDSANLIEATSFYPCHSQ